VAFSRPASLRIEVPGSTGAELVAVARAGELIAVFPSERAVFQGPATRETLEYLLGVGLLPGEVIDLLVGVEPAGVRDYRVGWGGELPERIRATLRDGAKLELVIEEPLTQPPVPEAAFEPPASPGFRSVTLREARELWSRR
jgi:hypothetical protein